MYKCSMAHSCDPAVLTSFGHIHQIAVGFWPIFGSGGASAPRSASYAGSQGTVVGVQYPSTWTLPAIGHQPWMTTTPYSMKRYNLCLKQMVRLTIGAGQFGAGCLQGSPYTCSRILTPRAS